MNVVSTLTKVLVFFKLAVVSANFLYDIGDLEHRDRSKDSILGH